MPQCVSTINKKYYLYVNNKYYLVYLDHDSLNDILSMRESVIDVTTHRFFGSVLYIDMVHYRNGEAKVFGVRGQAQGQRVVPK